jgi:hypothetical protein
MGLSSYIPSNSHKSIAAIRHLADECINSYRSSLIEQYGWTVLNISVQVYPRLRTLRARGEILSSRSLEMLARRLTAVLPKGWTLCMAGIRPVEALCWRSLSEELTQVWGSLLAAGTGPVLSTQLLKPDGPIEVLAQVKGAYLIRATDGTIGWVNGQLSSVVESPRLPARRRSGELSMIIDSYLGTPYLRGGTTKAGIDCSGLVQRIYREHLGCFIPRHSTDQLSWTYETPKATRQIGDLIFTWTENEGPCHVGLLGSLQDNRIRIVHASFSRGCVCEVDLESYIAPASRAVWRSIAQIAQRYDTMVGSSCIDIAPSVSERLVNGAHG